MPRRAQGLTAAQVEKGTTPGRFGDDGGLYLLVRSREAKFWLFRFTRHGKMREMGLGPASGRAAVKLAQARVKARELHAVVREGRDPLAERDAAAAKEKANDPSRHRPLLDRTPERSPFPSLERPPRPLVRPLSAHDLGRR
jgi:hypothetical protein